MWKTISKLCINTHCKSGTISSSSQTGSTIYIWVTNKVLCIACNFWLEELLFLLDELLFLLEELLLVTELLLFLLDELLLLLEDELPEELEDELEELLADC